MTLLLREGDVKQLLTMADAIDTLETAFGDAGAGVAQNLTRQRIVQRPGVMHLLGGAVPSLDALGFKAYTAFPGGVRFSVNLYSAATGELQAVIEADWLGRMRTGAASGLATRYLARPDAATLGMIGAGGQAETQLLAMAAVRSLERARVFTRDHGRLVAFCARLSEQIGLPVEPAASAAEAVRGADIVVTATTSRHPVLEGEWLKPGAHLNVMGSNWDNRREIDDATIAAADLIVVDSLPQAKIEAGDLIIPASQGKLLWQHVQELGAVIAGKIPGRQGPDQITFFKSLGIGLEDVAVAALVYRLAREHGAGEEVRLFEQQI